jgi:hypothetical protein
MDPASDLFDPLKAAALHSRAGRVDEAWWLVFLAVHFGKHRLDGWRLARDVYSGLGDEAYWTWPRIKRDQARFRDWLASHEPTLQGRRFSNHRKYESLKATSAAGTAAIFESYVAWIAPFGDHRTLIRETHKIVGQNPREVFDYLYKTMSVKRFGRLGKFDFLTMLGKLEIAPIEPGSAYLSDGATGPLRGARLLFTGNVTSDAKARALDADLSQLDVELSVGMQALEDALCNWQKSPSAFRSFRG